MTKARKLSFMALFVCIGVALNVLTLPSISWFGRISFVYGFCYLAGILFGPVGGLTVAGIADLIQVVAFPQPGPFVPQLTLSNMMMAGIVGLLFKYGKFSNEYVRVGLGALICLFVCSAGLSAWGEATMLFDIYPYTFAKTVIGAGLGIESKFGMMSLAKLCTQWFWVSLNLILTYVIYARLKKFFIKRDLAVIRSPRVKEKKIKNQSPSLLEKGKTDLI